MNGIRLFFIFWMALLPVTGEAANSMIQLPILVSYTVKPEDNKGAWRWTTTFSRIPLVIPDSELDQKCADISSTGYCRLAIIAPTYYRQNGVTHNDRGFSLSHRTITGEQTIRQLLADPITNASLVIPDAENMGALPREGCAWTQIDTFQYGTLGLLYNVADYKAATIPALKYLNEALDSCVITQPDVNYCAMQTPSLDFDFGTLQLNEWDKQKITKSVSVYCTGNIKYKVSMIPDKGIINLSNNGTADILIDGMIPGSQIMTGIAGTTNHSVTATLSGFPDEAGNFNGSGALLVSYP